MPASVDVTTCQIIAPERLIGRQLARPARLSRSGEHELSIDVLEDDAVAGALVVADVQDAVAVRLREWAATAEGIGVQVD